MATIEAAGKDRALNIASIVIRALRELEPMRACVALQKEVWNFSDAELVPLRSFVVAEKIGGQVIGAFDRDQLVSFLLAVPGVRGGHAYLHSQMLAVCASYRNAGLGRQMKLFQREEALTRGFELIEWTFDPLEIKNAYLNIEKLGAIARRYHANQYGITSSPLQAGLPSDRLVAEWWLKSKRVDTLLRSGQKTRSPVEKTITVPAAIQEWKASVDTRARAREVQDSNRQEFVKAFAEGLTVLGYQRGRDGSGTFLLGFWDENWVYGKA